MHFTLVFRSHESQDLSYSLVFIPCPVWQKGEKQLINLNPEKGNYKLGSVKKLMNLENISKNLAKIKECAIIVHPEGHGTEEDLAVLREDLMRKNFKVNILKF